MPTTSKQPSEQFPQIGTIVNPAIFSDGHSVLLCYEVAPVDGGGNVIIEFRDVIHFEQNPMNVKGLGNSKYPAKAWDFCEIIGSTRTERWKALKPRFWMISFNDVTVEIVFGSTRVVHESHSKIAPSEALKIFMHNYDV